MSDSITLVRPARAKVAKDAHASLDAFLAALSDLSDRFGIGLSDGVELFMMEQDDRLFSYRADADSRLSRA